MTDTLLEQIRADREAWWRPVRTDAAWLAQLRKDYPENAHMSDDSLRDYYEGCQRFSTTWDHTGDAYAEYEPLAERFLAYEARILRDAETIKAAEELADAANDLMTQCEDGDGFTEGAAITLDCAIAAFRATQEKNDG